MNGARYILILSLLAAVPGTLADAGATTPSGFSVSGESFAAIVVPRIDEASTWYRRVELKRIDAEDGRYSIRLLAADGVQLELLQLRDATPRPAEPVTGLFKCGFFVNDIEAARAWLTGLDIIADTEIFTDTTLRARSFVFSDPYGNRLQLFQQQ